MKEENFIKSSYPTSTLINTVNLTPLIDVTLVVLIIFILIAPLLDHGIDVDLPQASKQRMKEKQEKVTISVAKENRIYLDNAKISILKLEQRLKQIKEANKNIAIVLRADKKIPYKNIINILDIVKKAKIDNISLAVRGK
jgi:biopolymer transport protein ExbD